MKLLAQHGAMCGEKIEKGLSQSLIDGVIFSPRDINPIKLKKDIASYKKKYPDADFYLDPQYYICLLDDLDKMRLGHLADEYPFFLSRRRAELNKDAVICEDIERILKYQKSLPVAGLIAPNILISRSFDSREAGYSIEFINNTKQEARKISCKPVFATLAISAEALQDKREMEKFANEITALSDPPDGFYILVAADNPENRGAVMDADVIGAWMFLAYALKTNGYKVMNGYSDLVSPLLAAVGADAGASGWWSNLRIFSISRFLPSSSRARQPVLRYLSSKLWNRITVYELDALRKLIGKKAMNGLAMDSLYPEEDGSLCQRNEEVLQSWEVLKSQSCAVASKDLQWNLEQCKKMFEDALAFYAKLDAPPYYSPLKDRKTTEHRLEDLLESINVFKKLAEF